jgi:hypothetical protein
MSRRNSMRMSVLLMLVLLLPSVEIIKTISNTKIENTIIEIYAVLKFLIMA